MGNDKKASEGGSVKALPTYCTVGGCGKKADKSTFCGQHFLWFKEGLINRKGEKPRDFDRKYHAFTMKQKKAA